MTNDEMRNETNNIVLHGHLRAFIYNLMRDNLPCGVVEQMVMNLEENAADEYYYTNGWLAQYADNIASRLESIVEREIVPT